LDNTGFAVDERNEGFMHHDVRLSLTISQTII
jgi:hypothetical protein